MSFNQRGNLKQHINLVHREYSQNIIFNSYYNGTKQKDLLDYKCLDLKKLELNAKNQI